MVEKLENGMDASEEFAEKAGSDGTAGKKKLFRKNQVIITALAIMIAAAGYINYADGVLQKEKASDSVLADGSTTVDADTILQDISSLDYDITDE